MEELALASDITLKWMMKNRANANHQSVLAMCGNKLKEIRRCGGVHAGNSYFKSIRFFVIVWQRVVEFGEEEEDIKHVLCLLRSGAAVRGTDDDSSSSRNVLLLW